MDNFRRILLGGNGGMPPVPSTPGVYAFFIDGSTSQSTSYTEAQKANIIGVLVVANYPTSSDIHKIVIDKTNVITGMVFYGGENKYITGATTTEDKDDALEDMNGKANTIAISDACHGYNDGSRIGSVAEDCQPRFNGQGYLPSMGEWKMLYNNKSAVDTMMAAIGGTAIADAENPYYVNWSSTLGDASTQSWEFTWSSGYVELTERGWNDADWAVRAALDPETYIPFPKTTDTPGVYAYFKDGSVSTATSYTEAQKANIIGVLVVANYPTSSDLHKIVLDKTDVSNNTVRYGGYNKYIDLATITTTSATAFKDMNGKVNTVTISYACHGYNDGYRTGSAAEDCQARLNGQGHLPSAGEWKMLYDNKSAITTMMAAIGGTALQESYYWSSTLYNTSSRSWNFGWNSSSTSLTFRYNDSYVRAVMQVYY